MRKILALLTLILTFSGCLQLKKSDPGTVLARFDGEVITDKDFLKKVEVLPKALQKVAMAKKKDLLEDMAAEHLLMKEADRQGIAKDPDVKDLVEKAHQKIIIAKLVEKEIDKKISITPEEVAQYYDFHKEEFATPLLMNASHILVKTEEEALSVKSILDGGADFEETARQKSLDVTAARGGDLGFFQKGQFVPEFEQAALTMKAGEISGPVKTPFGYHIIRLNDRAEPKIRELKSVKKMVEERLVNEKRSRAFREYVARLKGNLKLELNDPALESLRIPGSESDEKAVS